MERTLLLVDDEENILRSLVRLLRRDGYTILTAHSGREGLDLLDSHTVGVILSDQRMPGMMGVEFLQKAKEKQPATVRMMLSGYTELQSVTDAINRGSIYKFLTKPWDDEGLRESVRRAFEHYEQSNDREHLAEELRAANIGLEQTVAVQGRQLSHQQQLLQISHEVLEHLPVGVLGVDGDGIIAVANGMAHTLLERPHGTLPGSAAMEVLPPELRRLCKHGAQRAAGTEDVCDLQIENKALRVHCVPMAGSVNGNVLVLVPVEGRTTMERDG